jgi:hypothetical protein
MWSGECTPKTADIHQRSFLCVNTVEDWSEASLTGECCAWITGTVPALSHCHALQFTDTSSYGSHIGIEAVKSLPHYMTCYPMSAIYFIRIYVVSGDGSTCLQVIISLYKHIYGKCLYFYANTPQILSVLQPDSLG